MHELHLDCLIENKIDKDKVDVLVRQTRTRRFDWIVELYEWSCTLLIGLWLLIVTAWKIGTNRWLN